MMIIAAAHLSDQQAHDYGLVLSATGIQYELMRTGSDSQIRVEESDVEKAVNTIKAYLEENPDSGCSPLLPERFEYRGSLSGVWVAVFLLSWHAAMISGNDLNLFIQACGASADKIMNGEIYRCVTAMLLHVDIFHLVSNMAGICILGSAVCSFTGWGIGWLMILISGILGNLINAVWYQTDHMSVGASTAVFASMGLLCAHQFCRRIISAKDGISRAFIPIAAGIALLGFLSSGTHVDITAHLFGFCAGLLIGGGWSLLIRRVLPAAYQIGSLISCIVIIAASWLKVLGG